MATRYHIGAKDLRGDIAAYAKRFDLLEVQLLGASEQRLAPTASTMRKWRRAVTPSFEFSVVAGPNLSRMKAGDSLESELAAAKDAIDSLQARCIVLRTPADVTPSKVWRDRIARVIDQLPRDATTVVWEPSGVWETGDAAVFAKKCEIVLGVDPSRDPVPAGPIAYGRLRALGESRSFGSATLERVATSIGDRREAYVVIESDSALAECKRLRTIAQKRGRRGAGGGMGRVVRPRAAALRVGDDEQE